MTLVRANRDLKCLKAYLATRNVVIPGTVAVSYAAHSSRQDQVNREDSRAFCYVENSGTPAIYCTKAIEWLPPEARIGVLLHEIGHLVLKAFEDDESEVDVDEWCVTNFPEAKYAYADVTYYTLNKWGKKGEPRVANSLQTVSPAFVHLILERFDDL
jgi:hypothetical protein